MKCYNCKCNISTKDIAIFRADLYKNGIRDERLELIPDLCTNCEQTKTTYQIFMAEFEEY